jgi:hypothetical protein
MEKKNPFAPVEINQNMFNLYTICLQYLQQLVNKNHPKLHLITEVLDKLIELRRSRDENVDTEAEEDDENFRKNFDKIHDIAFKNINLIYDHDKEQEDMKKLDTAIKECKIVDLD